MDNTLKLEIEDSNENCSPKNVQCQRPRRNVMQRSAEYNHGLLWTEEKELKKALYASLYQSKKGTFSDDDASDVNAMEGLKKRKCSSFRKGMQRDDNSSGSPKRAKVHAQRKFAQGSNPSSPSVTPVKLCPTPVPSADVIPQKKPKTEDFLTFLCLRGTPLLPSSLDYLNVLTRQSHSDDVHCRNPVNGEINEKPKPPIKQPNFIGMKMPSKTLLKPTPVKPVRAQGGLKKLYDGDDFSSSTESSLSDTDDEICNIPEKNKPVIYDMTKKKTIDVSGVIGRSSWLSSGSCLLKAGVNMTRTNAVQVLRQKYRQQRFAKKKEAVKRTRKMDLVAANIKKEDKVITSIERAPQRALPMAIACATKGFVGDMAATRNVVANVKKELSGSSVSAAFSRVCHVANSTYNVVPTSEGSDSKPVTRYAAMLLKNAREVEANEKCVVTPVKPKVEERPRDTVDLPLLESEHSYVKRLPVIPAEEVVKPVRRKPQRRGSDFSSDDDVPLAKRTRDSFDRATKSFKGGGNSSNSKLNKKKVHRDPVLSNAIDVGGEEVVRTPTGRPSRKTKEAATVYLELLGRKLNAPDDDFDLSDNSEVALLQEKSHSLHSHHSKGIAVQKSNLPIKCDEKLSNKVPHLPSNRKSGASNRHVCMSKTSNMPSKNLKKIETRSSSEALDRIGSGVGVGLERRDPVKTREFMKKLSEAQFKLAKAHGVYTNYSSSSSRDQSPLERKARVASSEKNKTLSCYARKEARYTTRETSRSRVCGGEVREVYGVVTRKNVHKSEACCKMKQEQKNIPGGAKCAYGKKCKDLNKLLGCSSSSVPNERVAIGRALRPHVPKVVKHSFKRHSSSSEDSDDTCVMKVSPVRRFGRPFASSRMRHYGLTSSDSSSESSEDNPSKPETTTISVRQNVPSNSVAVQVNLMNDIPELDDDFWEPGFMDADIENLFSMDRDVTPTLSKGASPSRSSVRTSWDGEASSGKGTNRSGASTPTKKVTPDRAELLGVAKHRTAPKTPSKLSSLNSTAPPCSKKPARRVDAKPYKSKGFSDSDDDDDDTTDSESAVGGGSHAQVIDAPVYCPNAEDFQDPLLFIEKIRPEAERFGVCKIVPPVSFKPECKLSDDMRFTAHNQYVHKMLHRSGPNVQQLSCIRKHLEAQGIEFSSPPLIGGMELDLPRLFQTVQEYGGLKEVIEKKKWQKVADSMKIVKSAQDRVTKLYDAYCKFLLPYDTLSKEEKQKLESPVFGERQRKCCRLGENDECVTKGRSMSLSSFCRIARNTMAMWFKNEPKPTEVEQEYWRCVREKLQHVCVHAGNIDSSTYGYGFLCNKSSQYSRHQWNLKVLTNNPASILRCLGPVMGITIPTLHVGMLFTTGCWYRDPHCLPWIEYLHKGASKIWYAVPANQSNRFRDAMNHIVPEYCTENPIWLPSDMAMVPPSLLVERGASLCRLVQNSGEFVVVFPRAFTSTICCGYTVSESVYFATPSWLEIAPIAFKEILDSCEPAVFSLQRLLIGIVNDPKVSVDILREIMPLVKEMRAVEMNLRKQLYVLGLKHSERMSALEVKDVKKFPRTSDDQEKECEICRANCYISLVFCSQDDVIYCLHHAVEHLQKKKKDLKFCKLLYRYDQAELNDLVQKSSELILQCECGRKRLGKKSSKANL